MAEEQLEFEEQDVSVEIDDVSDDQVEGGSLSGADVGADAGAGADAVEEDQFEKASNATHKRINQLTKKMRQAEREREEALRFAQQVQNESTSLKDRLEAMD